MWVTFSERFQKLHAVQLMLLLVSMLGIGWMGGFLSTGGGQWVADAFRLAYLNQYQTRTALSNGGISYYVSSTDIEKLQPWLESEEGVLSTLPTFIDDLLIVVISREHPETYNRLKTSQWVRVITTLPLLCH